MKRIGIISDTHGYLHPRVFSFFKECNEIWHAGDIGDITTLDKLNEFKPVRAVYGNIDGGEIRISCKEYELFTIDELKVLIIHIGGYPGKYTHLAHQLISKYKPDLFISGHSHILKVIPDKKSNLLHINPGAAGNSGQHQVITFIRLTIERGNMKDLEIFEVPRRI
ncbi:MAG: metallophosphoesterase family protein [Bacteroidota bacterium]